MKRENISMEQPISRKKKDMWLFLMTIWGLGLGLIRKT